MNATHIKAMSLLLLTTLSNAQLWLGGPGLPVGQYYIYEAPDYRVFNLGYYYSYEVHGYYGRTDADQVDNTYVDANGYMRSAVETYTSGRNSRNECNDSGGSLVYGWVHAAVVLNNKRYSRKMNFQSNRVHETTGDKVFSGSVYRATDDDVYLGFYVNGNTNDPDGYMVVFGAVIKDPPRPTGKLVINSYVQEDTNAEISYEIDLMEGEDAYEDYDWDPSMWTEELPAPENI